MRPIKFRAWDAVGKVMTPPFSLFSPLEHVWAKNVDVEYEAMQYTGLKDKNGVEIYEGDIYQTPMTKADVVKWNRAGFNPLENEEYIEIIGNIYENPALLTAPSPDKASK